MKAPTLSGTEADFIVTEYVAGETLSQKIADKKLPLAQVPVGGIRGKSSEVK